eukprot:903158_1
MTRSLDYLNCISNTKYNWECQDLVIDSNYLTQITTWPGLVQMADNDTQTQMNHEMAMSLDESILSANTMVFTKKQHRSHKDIYFLLNKDIYNFFCLMVEYGNFRDLQISDKISLSVLTAFSLLVQMSGIIFMATSWPLFRDDLDSDLRSVKCKHIEYLLWNSMINGTNFVGTTCEIQEETFWTQGVSSSQWIAKFVSVSIVICFVYSNITSGVRYSVILSKPKPKCTAILWIVLVLIQITIVGTSMTVIVLLVEYSIQMVDIFSIGVGFIILMEIDDVMYNAVSNMNPYENEDDIFKFKFDTVEKLKNTVYSIKYMTPSAVDTLTFIGFAFLLLLNRVVNVWDIDNAWWSKPGSTGYIVSVTLYLTTWLFMGIICVFPLFYTLFATQCRCCRCCT